MRMLLVAGVLVLAFTSCLNVENYREPIEEVTTAWEHTTTMFSSFINSLQIAQQELQHQLAEMTVPEALVLSEESADRIAELQDDYQKEMENLSDLSQNVSNFISGWQEKSESLTGLKDGLASGRLEADAAEDITELQTTVSEAESALESWRGKLEDIRTNTGDQLEEFNTLIAKLQEN